MADVTIAEQAAMPRFADGFINLQEVLRQLAESVVNEITSVEADRLCEATHNSGSGYRERSLVTCVGTPTLGIPKLRTGSFFPDDAIERCQRVDRAIVAAVSETCATGTSTRKARRVAQAMGIERLSKDQVSAICGHLGSEVEELVARPIDELRTPCLWIDAAYVKRGRDRRVASTAVVTAVGCDEDGWGRVLGIGVVDTESYDSWSEPLGRVKARGAAGVRLKDAGTVRAACHLATEMLESCCPKAAEILELAEPDALAYLDLPASHWKRLRTNNVQERANGEIKRRPRVAQVFPSVAPLERLAGAAMCDMDEEWQEARYFSKRKMDEFYDESGPRSRRPPNA